jgi:hypothetical protein
LEHFLLFSAQAVCQTVLYIRHRPRPIRTITIRGA